MRSIRSGRSRASVFDRVALARALAADLIAAALSAVGKHLSESPGSQAEIETYADALADMFCAYLKSLEGASQAPVKKS